LFSLFFAKTKIIIFSQLRTAAADFSRRAALKAVNVFNDLKVFNDFFALPSLFRTFELNFQP